MVEGASAVVIGDALIDEIREGRASREYVGGAALNVAVGLSVLGTMTTLIAMVGEDEDGDRIREFVGTYGVRLLASPAPHGTSRATSDRSNGEPSYGFNEAAQRRRITLGPAERAAIDAATAVVISCFPFDDQPQFDVLEAAIANPGERLFLDPNPRTGMLHDRALFVRNFERLAARSLLTKVGDEDAALLYGASLAGVQAGLVAGGARSVLATAGSDGATIATRDGTRVSRPVAALPGAIVDTMGAGDATLASVTRSTLTSGLPADVSGWTRLLDDAMAIAAATCRSEGALLRRP